MLCSYPKVHSKYIMLPVNNISYFYIEKQNFYHQYSTEATILHYQES